MRKMRRTRPSPAARLRAFWLLGIVLVGLFAYGAYQLLLWPGFHLTRMEVNGTSIVSVDEVIARANLDSDVNIWVQNMRAARRRIEKIPYVRKAAIHRGFPAQVRIEITERTPDGCVEGKNGDRFLVDETDRVLEDECAPAGLPLYRIGDIPAAPPPGIFLHAERLARLQADAHALQRLQPGTFIAFTTDRFGELEATMRSGIIVRFGGDEDLAGKARLVRPILATLGGRAAQVKVVDVRAPAAPIVEFRASRRAQD